MLENYLIFLLLVLIAEVLGTVSGFGSSIFFVPVASIFFDIKTVLGITAVFHVFSNLSKIALFRTGIQKDIVIKLGIPAVLFVTIGAYITTFLPTPQIELVMNIVLIILAVFLVANFKRPIKRSNTNLYIGGVTSGFLAGVAGTGGAIRGITLAAFQLSKDSFVATSALIDLGVDLSRSVVYVSNGYFKLEYLWLLPFLMVISFVGSWIGKLILKRTSENAFRYLVLIVIVLTAVIQIYRYLHQNLAS
jgi:uncharacterized membrane protein YfcA